MDIEVMEKFDSYDKTNQSLMDKIDRLVETVNDIKVSLAGLPQAILANADNRYASKSTENILSALKDKIENRNYDWLKWAIVTLVGIIFIVIGVYELRII
jgi:hypothetical protein